VAYFYVKNSLGTRTTGGGYGAQQTGTFAALGAANVYAKIEDAIADGAGAGDFICCSDAHSYSAATLVHSGPSTAAGAALYIVSVDDANCEIEKAATAYQEDSNSSNDFRYSGYIHYISMWLRSADDFLAAAEASIFMGTRSTIEVTGSGDLLGVGRLSYSTKMVLNGCTIKGAAASSIYIAKGGLLDLNNCTTEGIDGSAGLVNGWVTGGGTVIARGCDFSTVTGSALKDWGSSATQDTGNIFMDGCRFGAGFSYTDTVAPIRPTFECTFVNCSAASGSAPYQYYRQTWGASLEDETGIYRDDSIAIDGTKLSYKLTSNANCYPGKPAVFELPTRFAALSNAASDVLTVHILSATTLNDDDVFITVSYPDGTNKHIYNVVSSEPASIFSTPAALTSTTETWTGRTTENRYKIDIDTSSDAGADSVPIITAFVTLASTTIYFCSTVEVS